MAAPTSLEGQEIVSQKCLILEKRYFTPNLKGYPAPSLPREKIGKVKMLCDTSNTNDKVTDSSQDEHYIRAMEYGYIKFTSRQDKARL